MVNLGLGQTPRYGKLRDPDYDRGDFVFVLPDVEGGVAAAANEADVVGVDMQVWREIKDSADPADFVTFIESFPASPMVPYARNKLQRLTRTETALVEPMKAGSDITESTTGEGLREEIERNLAILEALTEVETALVAPTEGEVRRFPQELVVREGGKNWIRVPDADGITFQIQGQEPTKVEGQWALFLLGVSSEEPEPIQPPMTFKDCRECPELVVIPPGEFVMGSPGGPEDHKGRGGEGPQHRVRIEKAFALGRFELTRTEFGAFAETSKAFKLREAARQYDEGGCWAFRSELKPDSWLDPGYAQTDVHPVACVSWDDATAYVGWLSRKTGKAYRLASESEWEYAARAGATTARYWGEKADQACQYANVLDRTSNARINLFQPRFLEGNVGTEADWMHHDCDDGYAWTAPVGTFAANAFGLHDMLGNVSEWVEDCWSITASYREAPIDGSAWVGSDGWCVMHVFRGGSWGQAPVFVRARARDRAMPDPRYYQIGFRVARTLD